MSKRLANKVTIVTGATSGIGRATAVRCAEEGAIVIATGRNEEQGRKTESLITEAGSKGLFLRHDVTSEESWNAVISETIDRFGRLDVLVNNAGTFMVKPIGETTESDWDFMWKTNVDGTFLGTKLAMQAMRRNPEGGSIVNMSSLMGLVGFENATAYCAAKGAVTHFTRAAAADGAASRPQVRVNVIHPGVIWTEMLVHEFGEVEDIKNYMIEDTPLKRLGTPVDIANGVVYLASDAARYVTGASLVIDGGRGAD